MSIKYSEILTASEVLSAGDDDIIVLAIVDVGAPTGYTTKAIKKSNLITGSAQNLQQVLDTGSTATGITTGMTVLTEDTSITFESSDVTGGNSFSILDLYAQNTGAVYASLRIEDDGANVTELNFTSPSDGVGTFTFTDDITSKGLVYAADYSANFTNESLVTKRYVDASAGGNTIYTANDTILTSRELAIIDDVTFGSNLLQLNETLSRVYIGDITGTGVFNIDGEAVTGFVTEVKRDFDAGVGLRGMLTTVNPYGSEVRKVRTNGTALSIFNEWTIGDNRKSFDFIASVNNNYLSVFQSTNGTTENVRIGEIDSWWVPRNTTAFGFAFGHTSPTAGTVHLDNLDLKVEGTTDVNLLITDFSTNQLSIGSTPYANVKASITNTEAQTYSLLVLSQDTSKEFGVMETGVVYTTTQLSVGAGTAPTSLAAIVTTGDVEIAIAKYVYFGPETVNGSYRHGADGLGNFVLEERIAGVWTNLQTW